MDLIDSILKLQKEMETIKQQIIDQTNHLKQLQQQIVISDAYQKYEQLRIQYQEKFQQCLAEMKENDQKYLNANGLYIEYGTQIQQATEELQLTLKKQHLLMIQKQSSSVFKTFLNYHRRQTETCWEELGEHSSIVSHLFQFVILYRQIQKDKKIHPNLQTFYELQQKQIVATRDENEENRSAILQWKYYGRQQVEEKKQQLQHQIRTIDQTEEYQAIMQLPQYQELLRSKEEKKSLEILLTRKQSLQDAYLHMYQALLIDRLSTVKMKKKM